MEVKERSGGRAEAGRHRGQALQPRPQVVDLIVEGIRLAAVVDDPVRLREPFLARRLPADAGPGVGLVHSPEPHEAIDGGLDRHVDDDRRREAVAGVLRQERDVQDDDVVGAELRLDPTVHLAADRRMHDPVEVTERLGITEDDRGDGGTVQTAVRRDDVAAEAFGHRRQHRRARLLDLASDRVGIDDDGAPLGEHRRDGRFPGADPARQPHEDHPPTILPPPFNHVQRRCPDRTSP